MRYADVSPAPSLRSVGPARICVRDERAHRFSRVLIRACFMTDDPYNFVMVASGPVTRRFEAKIRWYAADGARYPVDSGRKGRGRLHSLGNRITGNMPPDDGDVMDAVFDVVRAVPEGRVVTYAQVADAVGGVSLTARQVGGVMRYAPTDVPWHRVVGAGGRLPIGKRSAELRMLQRSLLARDGVAFLASDPNRVDMRRSQWLCAGVDARIEGSFEDPGGPGVR